MEKLSRFFLECGDDNDGAMKQNISKSPVYKYLFYKSVCYPFPPFPLDEKFMDAPKSKNVSL